MQIKKETSDMMRHSKTGKELYKQNAQGVKIRHLENLNHLKEAIRYCMALAGIRKDNLPSEAQKLVLFDFVKNELGRYTLDEVKTAFKLAVSDKLSVKGESYQNFSCGFFSGVMSAYDIYIRNVGFKRESLTEIPEQNDNTDYMTELQKIIDESIAKKTNLLKSKDYGGLATYIPVSAIAYRVKAKYSCKMTREEKIRVYKECCSKIKMEHIQDINKPEYKTFLRIIKGETKDSRNKYHKLAVTSSQSRAFEIWLESKY